MILTGTEIERERGNGRITIEPFTPEQVNPNSYNFRLGRTFRVYRDARLDARVANEFQEIEIPDDGYVLEPGRLYLAHTIEVLGSEHYAPTFAARSSVARLGLFINLSACLGDIGYVGQWTLQLYTMNRVRVYPGMSIGQMMWWRPQGEILLYDGKYQGAVGPRSSDIHVDFDRQFARQRFPGLGASVDPGEVGPKFAALAALGDEFKVPVAFSVPAGEFTAALGDRLRADLAEAFADLQATVGAFFDDSVRRIAETVAPVRLPEQARTLLAARINEVFGSTDGLDLAVRSSGLDEDSAGSSLAGIHHSVLGVGGAEEAIVAVEDCWRSYYQAPAVAARVRAGDFSPVPRLAVIVQALVRPRWAGVAFTGLDGGAQVSVEYVEGLADGLVAGVALHQRADSAEPLPPDLPEHAALLDVFATATALRERHGHDVDVEWAADAAGVHVLQVRPLTATRTVSRDLVGPHIETYELYFDDLPAGFSLGEVAAVYGGYVAKRAPAHRLARAHGIAVGAGWVLGFNGLGLADPPSAERLRGTLATGGSHECVLDLGEGLRQIVVPKESLVADLARMTGAGPRSADWRTAVVRDFIRGELGVITRLSGAGMLVEYTPDGLMALNRGTTGADTLLVEDVTRPARAPGNTSAGSGAERLLDHLDRAAELTTAMTALHGPVTLEWVYSRGALYFVDYSVLGTADTVRFVPGAACISPGTASGPLLRLDDDELLTRLSIGPAVSIDKSRDVSAHQGLARIAAAVRDCPRKPIVHASRPYAVLSVLIGDVAGFVFDQGSVLGHLAILLREAGLPAVAVPGVSGTQAVISDGTVTTTGAGPGGAE